MGKKEVVLLTGASGSMGFETFKQLWEKRDRYDIVLLLRPSKKNRKKFQEFEQKAGKSGETHLKIIWGDDSYFNARSMDVYITKLRKHLAKDEKLKIVTIHGQGFRLVIDQ